MIEPTHTEVMRALKESGCTWAYGQGCECFSGIKNQGCYDREKKRLTLELERELEPEPTPDEIKAIREQIAMDPNSAQNCLKEFFNEIDF